MRDKKLAIQNVDNSLVVLGCEEAVRNAAIPERG